MPYLRWSVPILFAPIVLLLLSGTANAQFGSLFGNSKKVDAISLEDLRTRLEEQRKKEFSAIEKGDAKPKADFVLVDVRSEEEIAVSVIPGAVTKTQFERDRELYKGKTVIPYCTVGGRSAKYASQLAASGASVLNFQGSILEWVRAELPLVTVHGEPTNRVHIYSDRYQIPSKYEAITK